MSDTVIRVENLSKHYRIGLREKRAKTIKQAVKRIASSPFKYLNSVLREPTPEEMFWALQNVSFEVKRGDVVGIIGRNGAGKSTLLKILSQITEPSSGYAEIRGRVRSLLEVGTGFHPDLTGRENIYLNGTIMGMRKLEIDRRFDEIVDFAEVEKFIDTPVKHYSSGMYTRLAFAVAAHLTPEILIVDEVLAVGDAQFQKKCLGKMKDVSLNEGRTVIFVSHNMGAITSLCSRAILLQSGELSFEGSPNKAISNYMIQGSEIENKGFFLINEGDEYAHLKSIEIVDINGIQTDFLLTGKPFGIKVDFSTLKSGKNPQPCFLISAEDGTKLFQSINKEIFKDTRNYTQTAWFNPNILNDGRYVLTLALTTPNPVEIHISVEILIEVLDDPNDEARGDYKDKMHGYLRPQIKWL